ncbi:hypothetical protein GGX14DRAFT_640568, partial [Mycena pura]
MSEIDDIFAKRPVASTSAPVPPKKNQKKRKTEQRQAPEMNTSELSNKRPAPETVVDPSSHPPQKKIKVDKSPAVSRADKDIDKFKDSRGTGPRRKTEEGWSIYKEDELGINDVGGGTLYFPMLSIA